MLKHFAKSFIKVTAKLFSIVINYNVILLFKLFISYVQWYSVKREFCSVGSGSAIRFPATIINPRYIEIGNNFSTLEQFRIEAYDDFLGVRYEPKIIIGDNVSFGTDCHIGCINHVEIGNNVLGASKIFITDHFHGRIDKDSLVVPPVMRPLYSKGPVIIEDNVWLGEGVVVLPGVRIGANSIIGANAVVTSSIPENSVVAGIPARVIKNL